MKQLLLLILISLCLSCSSGHYYKGITGKVVDKATGKPIEGALIVAQWTKTKGALIGLPSHDLSMITETLTDRGGTFFISIIPNDPSVNPPVMIIYKEGYIPWRNDSIFPSRNLVKDNEWNNNVTYKLDVFTDKYTIGQLSDFVDSGMTLGMDRSESKKFSDLANKLSGKKYDEIRKQKSMDK